jgi:hypothetical protein
VQLFEHARRLVHVEVLGAGDDGDAGAHALLEQPRALAVVGGERIVVRDEHVDRPGALAGAPPVERALPRHERVPRFVDRPPTCHAQEAADGAALVEARQPAQRRLAAHAVGEHQRTRQEVGVVAKHGDEGVDGLGHRRRRGRGQERRGVAANRAELAPQPGVEVAVGRSRPAGNQNDALDGLDAHARRA